MNSEEHSYFQQNPPHVHSSGRLSREQSYPPYNRSNLSLDLGMQPIPTGHGCSWSHSVTPTEERSWSSSPITGNNSLYSGSHNNSQFQADTSHEELYRRAKARIAHLEGQLETIIASFNKIIDKVPELLNVANPFGRPLPAAGNLTAPSTEFVILKAMGPRPKALDVEDYPHVKFWTLTSWKQYLANKRGVSNTENSGNRYLESDDGQPLDKSQVNKINLEAYSLWFFIRDAHRLPPTWGVAAADVLDFFRAEMARRCPEMLLCSDDWKTNYLATQIFATFKRSHGTGAGKKVKEEAKDTFLAEDKEPSGSSKRKIEDVEPAPVGTSKKTKMVSEKKVRGNDGTSKPSTAALPQNILPPSISITKTSADGVITSNAMTEDPVPAADSTNDASEALRSRPKIQLRSILFEPTTEDEQTEHTDLESRPSNPLLAPAGVPGSELPPLQSRIQSAPHPNDPQPALDARTNIVPTPTESPNSVAPQLSADATVASSTQDGGGSNAGANKGSRGKTMVPLKKRDAKGLCSDDWCKLNPTGTISQFNTYWNTIKDTPAAECYAPLGNPKPASRARRTTRQSGM